MPKKHRLTGAKIRAIRTSRRVHGTLFSLSVSPGSSAVPECACVVSKKVSLLAVVRNLVKRRCRAALLPHLEGLQRGTYLFHGKREVASASFADITADIARIIAKV